MIGRLWCYLRHRGYRFDRIVCVSGAGYAKVTCNVCGRAWTAPLNPDNTNG